ncbi:hypothetical protein P8C59_000399 [Phyllachora maydis]|uniref:Mediator of RNA polymerase II transcription subunit 10 n=1 Tax=Phyllachora maydis TaxID=1825666 RepID=A0AAD9HX48_9PEZI|nr:hypothetical protein P8C59_000399 [Phyllachora maydis]
MAPVNANINAVEQNVQDVIQSLFQMMVQVSNYDSAGKPSREVLANEMQKLSHSLSAAHATAAALPTAGDADGPRVPGPLVQYVENGRNPDIYTREFVELVRRMNQLARGKTRAFAGFRDVLARELAAANPELAADVSRVVHATTAAGEGAAGPVGAQPLQLQQATARGMGR